MIYQCKKLINSEVRFEGNIGNKNKNLSFFINNYNLNYIKITRVNSAFYIIYYPLNVGLENYP